MVRLQFTTSVSDGYIEGQVIDVARPSPQHLEWLRRGILRALPDIDTETALKPEVVEKAITRRGGRGRRTPKGPRTSPSSDDDEDAAEVPLLCPGGTVVCLGGGPSLTSDDVAHCRGKATVIAINDAHRLAPWAECLYSSDQRWWECYQGVPEFTGLKVGIEPLVPRPEWGITVLKNTGDSGLEMSPSGLRTGRNSGAAAVNLAVHFGATRVVLLGYDMGHQGGRSHWFGDHPARLRASSPYQTFIEMFRRMVAPLAQIGVEVLNCSVVSALDCFPRAALRDVL